MINKIKFNVEEADQEAYLTELIKGLQSGQFRVKEILLQDHTQVGEAESCDTFTFTIERKHI